MNNKYKKLIEATSAIATVKGYTHNFYRYPARFSNQFAKEVIAEFSKQGEQVLDPFMGGGTAIVEALALGRFAVGIDLNELAYFVTTVKTTPLSAKDEETVYRWLDEADRCEPGAIEQPTERVVNLPPHLARLFQQWLVSAKTLPFARQRNFIRCALLKTGQWALDCKMGIPTYCKMRLALRENINLMFRGLNELIGACGNNGIRKKSITGKRMLICRSSVGIENEQFWVNNKVKPRLVVTSPPYYGVHVVYHRWQVNGRKETPAPYWIANLKDGHGLSYYTFGSRRTQLGYVRYFETLLKSFKSVRAVIDPKAMVVQLVAFERAATQLPIYLDTMRAAGYQEVKILGGDGGQRVWREVPNRKWYSSIRTEEHDSIKEVLLLHRPAL
jgi:DNA methylase